MELAADIAFDLARRYAALVSRLAGELGERPMVLPTAEFFPDRFQGDHDSVARLLERMQAHAGIDDIPIVLEPWGDDASGAACDAPSGGSCGTCAPKPAAAADAPRVRDAGTHWVVNVPAAELAHPVVLTSGLARSLALVFLLETLPEGERLEEPLDVTVELAGVALGFGALLLEASYIYGKGCGGPSVGRATALSCDELAVAFASFIVARGERPRAALKPLSVTQAEALRGALDWLAAEPGLGRALASDPAAVAEQRELSGVDDRELSALAQDLAAARKAAKAPRAPDPRRDELRALVDEAFADVAAERDPIRT